MTSEKKDPMDVVFRELYKSREGYAGPHGTKALEKAAKVSTDKEKYPLIIDFVKTLPKGQKFFVDVGSWHGFFGHQLFKNNPKLMKGSYMIGLDSGEYLRKPDKYIYDGVPLEFLENVKLGRECIFQMKKFKLLHTVWADREFPDNFSVFGIGPHEKNLADYKNSKKLFTKDFLRRGIDIMFLRRMFQYVLWPEVIARTHKFTNAYFIIDYNRKNLVQHERNYKVPADYIPEPGELNALLEKKGFEIYKSEEKRNYFYTIARK
jgi:hypothetical protein